MNCFFTKHLFFLYQSICSTFQDTNYDINHLSINRLLNDKKQLPKMGYKMTEEWLQIDQAKSVIIMQ